MHRPALRRLAIDGDTGVASAAFFALGLLRDSASIQLASSALRAAPPVSAEASWLLGEVGAGGRSALIAAARDTSLGSHRRGAALLALARSRPTSLDSLVPLMADADTAIAWRAAYVLARGRSPAVVRALLAATRSPQADVRDHAARGLARSLAGDSLGADARSALRRLAHDSSARVRVTAVRVAAGYGDSSGAPIADALRDADPSVRIAAASFAHLAFDSAARGWDDAWRADTSFAIRRQLAESGTRRGRLASQWKPWHADARWEYRAAAAELDGLGDARNALTAIEPALSDVDGRVRGAAAGVLASLADSAATRAAARARLRVALADVDFQVRAAALGALATGATLEDLLSGLASYGVHRGEADSDARLNFWTLVDSALTRNRGPLPDGIERSLAALPRPTDPLERARASAIARFAAWKDETSVARDAGWYLARAREATAIQPTIARIESRQGSLELELFASDAPVTVHNFVTLARRGYFDGQTFHRVVPNFVVQGGDPRGDGNGGPGYAIRDELNRHRYHRGTLGMALAGPNTGGSQFFVTHAPQPHLDGGYTVFGRLRSGGDVLDRIIQGDRIVRITIQ